MNPAWLLGVTLLLPPASGVSVRVVTPPAETDYGWSAPRLALGADGALWFLHDGSEAANFTAGYRLRSRVPLDDVAALEGVGPVYASGGDLGYLVVDGPAQAAFQPIAELPVEDARLFSGSAGALYVAGRGKGEGDYELWALLPGAEGPRWKKLLSSTERIAAAAGDGTEHFAAIGRLVGKIEGGRFSGVFLHPDEAVTALAFAKRLGLVYATASGAGVAGPEGSVPFLIAERPEPLVRGENLYLFLPGSMTVLLVEHASALRAAPRKL
ncbi:MAG: hypothetical protein AUJ52_00515 [Elusimicrobia bacterium CG1_02_63_36]|nr:MAG: hypothetical protein AUJ52_00515 [Elusimicrobia bacterium CG1_02_63_36]PIP83339.1 MAG: hypothetical protein COR54_10035 [Elusimicrobia bacterium CG22_combo_CG10-13_8_21_14_all_63_91]PJA11399.1 MAG: hypothetical protein COX66_19960 [Elusimicrobia bacterium CG_4_10_14_0_2_um_filter_63_34]PJB24208.1 MAG: hypothetical protein CO113_15000 [Elusimicrobia bacterium CG_4_9_14_3_um_filter_62_55]